MLYQYQWLPSSLASKPLGSLLAKPLSIYGWFEFKYGTAARAASHFERLFKGGRHAESLIGEELCFGDESFTWHKFRLTEFSTGDMVLRYVSVRQHGEIAVKPLAPVLLVADVSWKASQKPKLRTTSICTGEAVGTVSFEWDDGVCDILEKSKGKLGKLSSQLTMPEKDHITFKLCGHSVDPNKDTLVGSIYVWMKTHGIEVPQRKEICKPKKARGPLKKSPEKTRLLSLSLASEVTCCRSSGMQLAGIA